MGEVTGIFLSRSCTPPITGMVVIRIWKSTDRKVLRNGKAFSRAAKALTTHTFAQIQFTVRPISGVRFFGASTGFTF